MTALLLSPHNDDAELFAAYTCLRHRPRVVVCLRSDVQERRGYGITAATREAETAAAMGVLGCEWEQWPYLDSRPIPRDFFELLANRSGEYGHVFAPAVEENGHEQHNEIGRIALAVFGPGRVTGYLTYTRTGGRSTWGVEVGAEPGWAARKEEALACYASQIAEPSTAPHFAGELREWLSA